MIQMFVCNYHKIIKKCKICVIYIFSNILIDNIVFSLHMYTSWTAFTISVFLYNDHPEDGLFGLKHVEGASHTKKCIWLLGPLVGINTV